MFFCGWDGGGTKTELYAVDEAGQSLGGVVFGPLNPNGTPEAIVRQTVRDAVSWMANLPGGLAACQGVVIGMSGVSNRQAADTIQSAVQNAGYTGPLQLLGDQEIALAGAIGDGPGAVLIAGTGSILCGRDEQGALFRVGGCGYLIDDGGSGYSIGRDLLAAAVRCADGRLSGSCIQKLVFDRLQVDAVPGVIQWLYAPGTAKKEVAALSPLLLDALDAGDAAAREIAHRAANELTELVVAGWRKNGLTGGELALTGSILTRYDVIRQDVIRQVHAAFPHIRIHDPLGSAAQGAAKLAMKM